MACPSMLVSYCSHPASLLIFLPSLPGIFSKVQALAGPAGLRLVAINRRDYIGSTPYSNAELDVVNNGTVAQRDDFMKARGIELGIFMDKFMQQNNIPALSADGRAGGAAVIGWSVGNIFTLSTIANIHALPEDVQARLASRIHTLVMQGAHTCCSS